MNDNSDNGDLNPDNPQVPADVVRGIDWVAKTRERLAREDAEGKASVKKNEDDTDSKIPKPRNFDLALRDANGGVYDILRHTGFLIATGAFVGVADVEGIIQAIVPLDALAFATIIQVPDAPATAA